MVRKIILLRRVETNKYVVTRIPVPTSFQKKHFKRIFQCKYYSSQLPKIFSIFIFLPVVKVQIQEKSLKMSWGLPYVVWIGMNSTHLKLVEILVSKEHINLKIFSNIIRIVLFETNLILKCDDPWLYLLQSRNTLHSLWNRSNAYKQHFWDGSKFQKN